jgi:hydroxymethylbilane synthase
MTGGTVARRTLTIGTRGSKLALVQTELVREALLARHPDLAVEVVRITTRGDAILDQPLATAAINDKGLFIGEIEAALRDRRIDLAVHSAKDLPSTLPPDMAIAAWTSRADPLDVLVSRAGTLRELPQGARVGTSSPRRACQLRALRPDLAVIDIRGNVDTRLRKLASGDYDAIVLAAAGLDRLGLADAITEPFGPETMLPAVGQGALAVEVRADDAATAALLAPLNDRATAITLGAERAFLAAAEGGCAAAVAAYATLGDDGTLALTGLIGAPDGRLVRGERRGPAEDAARLAIDLAQDLLARGGAALLGRPDVLPLAGRRIAVTRAGEAGAAFAARLRALGAEPIVCPAITIAPPEETAPLDEAIANIGRYDWLVFASANAVRSFFARLAALGRDTGALVDVQVGAVGPGTAAALVVAGCAPDYVVGTHTGEALAAELPDVAGARILLPAADIARPALADGLRARHALVDVVVAYRTLSAAPEEGEQLAALVRDGGLDALTFTSPSTVHGTMAMLDAAGVEVATPRRVARRPAVVCIGETTAEAARESGLAVDAVAEVHSADGMVAALIGHFSR